MAMVVDNQKIVDAKETIEKDAEKFATMAKGFIAELESALSTFEGETKDVLMDKKIGSSSDEKPDTLSYFLITQIPQVIGNLAALLEGNRTTIDESDRKLAEAISGGGQG